MDIHRTASKMKFKSALIALLLFSGHLGFAQTAVIDRKSIAKMAVIVGEIAALITENELIIANNRKAETKFKQQLALNYRHTVYDNSANTGYNLLGFAFNASLTALLQASYLGGQNIPYYPRNKNLYFEALNPIPTTAIGVANVDHDEMTHANKQKFYQARREDMSINAKNRQISRRLLYNTAAFLVLQETLDLVNLLATMETLD